MIVCVLSLGSLWQEPRDARPVVWNSTAVPDPRAGLRPRSRVYGQIRFNAAALHQAIGTTGIRGTLWHASEMSELAGIRKLALERRATRTAWPDSYVVAVQDTLVGALDEGGWQPETVTLVSFSESQSNQEALFLARPHAWLRGPMGCATFTPGAAHGDWLVTRW